MTTTEDKSNRQVVLECFDDNEEHSIPDIHDNTGVNKDHIRVYLNQFLGVGWIEKIGKSGRHNIYKKVPRQYLKFVQELKEIKELVSGLFDIMIKKMEPTDVLNDEETKIIQIIGEKYYVQ